MDIKKSGLDLTNYEIWYQPFWQTKSFYWAIGILVFLILGVVLILVIKKIKESKIKKLSPIEKFDHEIALLSKHKHNPEVFYIRLILIFKNYLSDTFNDELYSLTDDEIIDFLNNLNSSEVINIDLIIKRAQLVKFANSLIDENRIHEDLNAIKTTAKSIEKYKSNINNSKT
ncbi:MAG: hypothetical protein P4L22_02390 [Candidatus Babeliales bacterium]|nr:hypothetical protein [Candidatus Babeliales bacterium]